MPSRQLLSSPESAAGDREPVQHRTFAAGIHLIAAASSAAAAVFCLVLLSVFCCKIWQRRKRRRKKDDLACLRTNLKLLRFSYSHLRRATGSFSLENKLGQGGFGSVYRGTLDCGQPVAVKRMDPGSLQGEREFQNELLLAGKLAFSDHVVSLLGYCSDRKNRRLLVYEFMHNSSLQDALIDRKSPELMNWELRLSIALDVAKGLRFLHTACDPPIIHGDIKPSNVLLDLHFAAKIADFGLARLKSEIEAEAVVLDLETETGTAGERKRRKRKKERMKEEEVVSADLETESVATLEDGKGIRSPENLASFLSPEPGDASPDNTREAASETAVEASPSELMEKTSVSEACFDKLSMDSGGNRRGDCRKKSLSGRDWWWRQDGGSESGVKDYVMEWIGTEIKDRPSSGWMAADGSTAASAAEKQNPKRRKHKRLDWWGARDIERSWKKDKYRQGREWWREEFCEELTRKSRKKKNNRREGDDSGELWWEKDQSDARRKKKWRSRGAADWWMNGFSGEIRIGRRSVRSGDDVPKSGGISSTPSMRGTVCYVAPEYGGGGILTEKSDVYSYGVLLLVIISGRRPLQVTASPMTEFERANLISWSRHLAHSARLLELVDPNLKVFDREQALLCITVALLCLQRSPARRPAIAEVVKMLSGDVDLPNLPVEFSPSPPCGFQFKSSRRKSTFRSSGDNRDHMPS
ncbi:receptor-like serine/threonine-protein kinase At2g45590 [Nymphaea colorata]|uniref:non-specific serine/threonine protein kinase n=1 Tax=Nymphaea colorata TaxID=210225 RepID=A0A5K1AW35_9MAGN|nr:receptor-like serine/threonine-protein kinase At2g45590 [Nymphaea colorata]